jgi:hypothetical protein
MKQELMAFLKDKKIFTSGGHKSLRSYLDSQENKQLHKIDQRNPRKKRSKK